MDDNLLELAARCEAATGPDRELDRDIELAVYPARTNPSVSLPLLEYTASLDAAMTLVPEGWIVRSIGQANEQQWIVSLIRTFAPGPTTADRANGIVKTPALALCAAALRARVQA